MNYQAQDKGVRLEQHIGTILQIMVVGLLAWSLSTTVSLRTEVGILQAELRSIQTAVLQGTNDRYRATDAARDMRALWDELARMDKRLAKYEGNRGQRE